MKNLILLVFILVSNMILAQPGIIVINSSEKIESFQLKHMEENQYNQMRVNNPDSMQVSIYYEEYQAYSIIAITPEGYEYYATFKIDGGTGYKTIKPKDIQMICSCNYEFINVGESRVLNITF